MVLSRHAPRTRGDVVVFHRRRGHGDALDRPARGVRVRGDARDGRAERGGGGGGAATGDSRGVSDATRRDATRRERASSVRTEGEGKGARDRLRKRRRFHTHSRTTSRPTKGARATDDDALDQLDQLDARPIAPARPTRSPNARARAFRSHHTPPITVTTHRTPSRPCTRIHAHRVVLRRLERVTTGP